MCDKSDQNNTDPASERQERLTKALRDNLRRRKAQGKARAKPVDQAASTPDPDSEASE